MKILEKNKCTLPTCNCGWNITIGGTDYKELEELLEFLNNTTSTGTGTIKTQPLDESGKLQIHDV